MSRRLTTVIVALACFLLVPGRLDASPEPRQIGPGQPPGPPFQNCERGIIGSVKGFWCFVGDLRVFVPDQP